MVLIIFNTALTCLSIMLISRRSGHARACAFTAVTTLLAISTTTMHHEQWFAFLGELQSYLLAYTAFVVAAYCHPRIGTFCVRRTVGSLFRSKRVISDLRHPSRVDDVVYGRPFVHRETEIDAGDKKVVDIA